jgi:hypothetical protein
MKMDRIRMDTVDTDSFLSWIEFLDRIRIQIVYDVLNIDIDHIWILEIQLWKSGY